MTQRSAQEMMTLIQSVAEKDDNIRAIGMEGSRNNPAAHQDQFADFDITYFVKDPTPFRQNDDWLNVFGERLMMQKPTGALFSGTMQPWYPYLMQFTDGNRLDLKIACVGDMEAYLAAEHLNTVIFDKDHPVQAQPETSDWDFHIAQPTEEDYQNCVNEFFWVSLYVMKGLKRGELLYANQYMETPVRAELLKMLEWSVGVNTNFQISVGKNDSRLKDKLPTEDYDKLIGTYRLDSTAATWQSLQTASQLFIETARIVADQLGFDFPEYPAHVITYEEKVMGESSAVQPQK
ncbi:aminoglycoside 6-adenylyltransferase [Furfurilactobacillus rossiae]|uniref:Aminoglycoside 6-adenylyltansferase n=1 Tax=Furfurilactobacillus rossiae DSM 15814 TaxID=1114972 RepID=A0A0R1RA94_9LACO|nr:aminoglycoside 6-adenylyltransferase [Furfurilactobacillus rossiae]KRL53879.1 aminoglycoside 6-adenylyltansferase [Furfurilactobacillus rossiae DSM 15814]QFR66861.1 aminoglycoside 6-adenylyltransferase [Furfurilactobacillus rossiae]QLE62349.1 aminoglycoside 6-adenylyltransferase [Furfurilactobacillus rossiae]